MKKNIIFLLLLLFAANIYAAEKISVMNFHVVESSAEDERNLPEGFKTFSYFDSESHEMKAAVTSRTMSFDSSAIRSIRLSTDMFDRPCVEIYFSIKGTEMLDEFTGCNIGKNVIMEINGIVIANARIMERISGGVLSLSGCSNDILYEMLLNFDCDNQTGLCIPEKQVCLKEGKNYKTYENSDAANVTQLAAEFFLSVFNKNDDSYKEYVLPESLQAMEIKVESFRNNFTDCTIYAAETKSLKKSHLKNYKDRNIQVPLYIYIDNGACHIHENLIFVIDGEGRLKIQDVK